MMLPSITIEHENYSKEFIGLCKQGHSVIPESF